MGQEGEGIVGDSGWFEMSFTLLLSSLVSLLLFTCRLSLLCNSFTRSLPFPALLCNPSFAQREFPRTSCQTRRSLTRLFLPLLYYPLQFQYGERSKQQWRPSQHRRRAASRSRGVLSSDLGFRQANHAISVYTLPDSRVRDALSTLYARRMDHLPLRRTSRIDEIHNR